MLSVKIRLYWLWLLFVSFYSVVSGSPAPEAAITAAPVIRRSPLKIHNEREYGAMLHHQARALAARQSKPGLNVCFGTGSICDLYLDMKCAVSLEGNEWYKCQCTSGRVATNGACQACQDFYNLGGTFKLSDWAGPDGYCAEKGFELAPIPSSILSSWSHYNATMTAKTALQTDGSSATATRASGLTTSLTAGPGATGSSGPGLPTVSLSRTGTRTSMTGTITLTGNPTGTFQPTLLSTTTGIPPLQNAPAGSSAKAMIYHEFKRSIGGGVIGVMFLIGIIMVI